MVQSSEWIRIRPLEQPDPQPCWNQIPVFPDPHRRTQETQYHVNGKSFSFVLISGSNWSEMDTESLHIHKTKIEEELPENAANCTKKYDSDTGNATNLSETAVNWTGNEHNWTENRVNWTENAVKRTENAVNRTVNAVNWTENAVNWTEYAVNWTEYAVNWTESAVNLTENAVNWAENALNLSQLDDDPYTMLKSEYGAWKNFTASPVKCSFLIHLLFKIVLEIILVYMF